MRCTAENLRPEFPEEDKIKGFEMQMRILRTDIEQVQRIRDTIENSQGPDRYHDRYG